MSTSTIDYETLAAQARGDQSPKSVDYSALAAKARGEDLPEQTPAESSMFTNLKQGAIGAVKGAVRSVYNAGSLQGPQYLQGSGLSLNTAPAPEAVQPTNTAQRIGGYAETAGELAAPFLGVGKAAVAATEALPSFGKAAPIFEELKQSIGHIPIDMTEPLRLAQEAKSMMGFVTPKAVNDIIRELAPSGKAFVGKGASSIPMKVTPEPLDYNRVRDLYTSLSELSADEMQKLKRPMLRKIVEIASATDDSIRSAIPTMTDEQRYGAAMKEYAAAGSLGRKIEILRKYGIPAAAAGIGLAEAYKYLKLGVSMAGQ